MDDNTKANLLYLAAGLCFWLASGYKAADKHDKKCCSHKTAEDDYKFLALGPGSFIPLLRKLFICKR